MKVLNKTTKSADGVINETNNIVTINHIPPPSPPDVFLSFKCSFQVFTITITDGEIYSNKKQVLKLNVFHECINHAIYACVLCLHLNHYVSVTEAYGISFFNKI